MRGRLSTSVVHVVVSAPYYAAGSYHKVHLGLALTTLMESDGASAQADCEL